MQSYKVAGAEREFKALSVASDSKLTCQMTGLVGGEMREVEVWSALSGTILKVRGGSDVCILPDGSAIVRVDESREVTALDREILVGPALVLALALHGTWCLHASAALFRGQVIVFLGESGRGKSTLAAYLSAEGEREWLRVADDILPVTASSSRVEAWPRFPQLKLPDESQPGLGLPEQLPVSRICVLTDSREGHPLELRLLPRGRAVQVLAGHTAGARLFTPRLLAEHLAFSAEAARHVPVYELTYPRRRDALAKVKELLENSC